MSLYLLENLVKAYDRRKVLDIDRLELAPGKITALLGPNGAGKTTLLEILAFLSRPTSGTIQFRGRPVDFSGSHLRQHRIEVVLVDQKPIMFTTTLQKNLEFGLKVRGFSPQERTQKVDEVLDLVGLRDFRKARADRLSGGETQRAAIARALACDPKVLLLDEPTANVDVENRIAIENIIREINEATGLSVIFTTHDPVMGARLAMQTLFLVEGRPAESAYENIFSGRLVEENGERHALIQGGVRLPAPDGPESRLRISVDPWKLIVSPADENPGNGELTGRIIQATDEGDQVRLLVDVGVPLSVLVARDGFDPARLYPGRRVRVLCPGDAVRRF